MRVENSESEHGAKPSDEQRIPPGVGAMSIVRWGLVLVMGLVAVLSITYATGALAKVSVGGSNADHESLYYCPMHPSVVQDHAGECPICSMTLVPKQPAGPRMAEIAVAAKQAPGLTGIILPAERIQLIGMRTAKVERAALADSLRTVGVIAAHERGRSRMSVRFWFLADVLEQDAARLRLGQKAVLELAAYPGKRFTGRVQFIYPTLNTATRTLRVRLELANKTGAGGVKLRPGMYGSAALELPSASGLVIPSEALVDTGENQYVFVAKAEGHFEPRVVQVGARAGDKVQVTSGVAAGETVVTTGNFLLDSESRLRAAIDGK